MDLNMPKTDGISLLKQVKKDSQFTDIPVIIVTNSVDMDKLMDSYKLHAAGFVCKSLDYTKFIQSVRLVISYWAKAVSLPSM